MSGISDATFLQVTILLLIEILKLVILAIMLPIVVGLVGYFMGYVFAAIFPATVANFMGLLGAPLLTFPQLSAIFAFLGSLVQPKPQKTRNDRFDINDELRKLN
jgi:hypothetical protein